MTWEEYKAKGIPGRLEALQLSKNPTFVARVPSGVVVLGDSQLLPGYCVLMAEPVVSSLDDLALEARVSFLRDMALVGQAILEVYSAMRMNYSVLGNFDPFLHAHIHPRYASEPAEFKEGPAFGYPSEQRNAPELQFDPVKHGDMQLKLAERIRSLLLEKGLSLTCE